MISLIIGYFLIFSARVIDVSCATLRMLLLVRGKRLHAATIGFFEVVIYILALGYVVERLNDPFSIVIYGLGFASGNVVGSLIEEKMALGNLTVQVITMKDSGELVDALREQGFGVTILQGEGREGTHAVLHIILSRKRLPELMAQIEKADKDAFITVLDTRTTRGGVVFDRKGK